MKALREIDHMRIELGAWWNVWLERIGQITNFLRQPEGNWDEDRLKDLMQLDGEIDEIVQSVSIDARAGAMNDE